MLPFLKKKDEQVASTSESIKRKSDDDMAIDMIDAIADDMLAAMKAHDKEMLKQALEALVEHIKEEDEESDEQLLQGAE